MTTTNTGSGVTKTWMGVMAMAIAVSTIGCSEKPAAPPAAATATPASPPPAAAPAPGATATPLVERPDPAATAPASGAAVTPSAPPAATTVATTPSAPPVASSSAPSAAAPPAVTAPAAEAPPPPPPPRVYTLAAGHPLAVHTTTTLSTKTNHSGEAFTATLAEPIVDGDWVVAKKGARVHGVIVNADEGARVKGLASIAVTVKTLTLADGRTVDLAASSITRQAKATKKKDATKIGVGAGIGAAIGAIAGGGKGAAIGAGVGGGAGTGAVLATRGDPAVIPAETLLRFTLKAPIKITEQRPEK